VALGDDNISLAPVFLSATDHHRVEGSPGIDAGDNFFTPPWTGITCPLCSNRALQTGLQKGARAGRPFLSRGR
jgi:hypothetical protein